jgi:hypothetical protein
MISDKNLIWLLLGMIILISVFFYYLNNYFYNNKKFINYIHILAAIGSLVLGLTFLTAVVSYNTSSRVNSESNIILIIKDFSEGIINLFMENPEMNYFYDEIFNKKNNFHHKRNITLENQICMNIFAKTVEPISIINIYGKDEISVAPIKNILLRFLNILFQSNKVKNFYLYYYKINIAGPILIDFIEKHFGF